MSQFVFKSRTFADQIMPALDYRVLRYSHAAIGGPLDAEVEATGPREALYDLVEHLRAPVEIYDDHHNAAWWGTIQDVRVHHDNVNFGVSLDTMSNRVAVAYTEGHYRQTTDYASNALSVADYGTKDEMLSRSEITTADALQYRDTYLDRHKNPTPTIRMGGGFGEARALISCRGWLDTLDWRMYTNNKGKEAYETVGTEAPGREIGEDERPIYAQAFQLSSSTGWTATSIWLRLWKRGSPSDNITVALKSNSAGDPGATLASATIAGSAVEQYATWTEFTLNTGVALSTGTTYWIHISRSGSVDTSNYYVVGVNKDLGYQNGDPKYYNTDLSSWVDASHKGDLNFRVMGDTATDEQITDLITNVGEFFTGTQIINTSGVSTNAYRNGDRTALYELRRLLETGTTNDRRLLATVTPARKLQVLEEPAPPSASTNAYSLSGGGVLYDANGDPVDASRCKVGVWANLSDVVPASVDYSRLSNPTLFFIEEAEYDAVNNRYRILRTRDQRDVFKIGGVE